LTVQNGSVKLATMIVTVAAFKGGVGKTTSSIHLAAFMAERGKTVLVDGDTNRSATRQARRGSFPFAVWDERRIAMAVREHEHVVIDTEARPGPEDLEELAAGCDLLVLPTTPDVMSMEALILTAEAVGEAGGEDRYKVLLTLIPPPPNKAKPNRRAEEARAELETEKVPVFREEIRRLAAFVHASDAGIPVYEVKDPKAAEAWACYEAVGREVLDAG
jgi:chromosome partitioning protein